VQGRTPAVFSPIKHRARLAHRTSSRSGSWSC
jgi:hypothetical protein